MLNIKNKKIKNCCSCCWLLKPEESSNELEEFYRCIRFPSKITGINCNYEFPVVLLSDRCGEYN